MSGGVYAYRTRKPGAVLGLPFLGRHWAYVGETTSFSHRHLQHVEGGGRYGATAKPWSDLAPVCVIRIPLPPWKWLLRSVETLLILALWPAYNVSKNRWNPRRISPNMAAMQRRARNRRDRWFIWFLAARWYHVAAVIAVIGWWLHG